MKSKRISIRNSLCRNEWYVRIWILMYSLRYGRILRCAWESLKSLDCIFCRLIRRMICRTNMARWSRLMHISWRGRNRHTHILMHDSPANMQRKYSPVVKLWKESDESTTWEVELKTGTFWTQRKWWTCQSILHKHHVETGNSKCNWPKWRESLLSPPKCT